MVSVFLLFFCFLVVFFCLEIYMLLVLWVLLGFSQRKHECSSIFQRESLTACSAETTSCCHMFTQNLSTLNNLRTKIKSGRNTRKRLRSARSLSLPRSQPSPSRGMERPGLDLPGCKYGFSQGKSVNGVCSSGWRGDTWHSNAPPAHSSSCPAERLSISLSLSSAWPHFLGAEINSSSTVGHCWEEERKNLADLRSWQGIVQAPACRKPLPVTGVWQEMFWRDHHIQLGEGLCSSWLSSQLSQKQTQIC